MNQRLQNTLFAAFLAVPMLTLSACTKHSDLHNAMEDMGSAYKAMRDSQSIEEAQSHWADYKAAAQIASQQQVKPDDQSKFQEGMDELAAAGAALDVVLASGDLKAVKELLEKMGGIRKEYHKKLGVK